MLAALLTISFLFKESNGQQYEPAIITADILTYKFTDTEIVRYVDAILNGLQFKEINEQGSECASSIYAGLD